MAESPLSNPLPPGSGHQRVVEFLTTLGCLEPGEKLIRVVSWKPWWDEGSDAMCWPTILADNVAGSRSTRAPIWDDERFRQLKEALNA